MNTTEVTESQVTFVLNFCGTGIYNSPGLRHRHGEDERRQTDASTFDEMQPAATTAVARLRNRRGLMHLTRGKQMMQCMKLRCFSCKDNVSAFRVRGSCYVYYRYCPFICVYFL